MKTTDAADAAWMKAALALARRGLGQVWPNPAVGCVLVRDGQLVGRGWTQKGGRPHAETEALWRAGDAARGATAYVTLEPCSHHGKTPPCADALVAAGIARVVVACRDPDERVNGQGISRLRAANIPVSEGVCAAEAEELNEGFIHRVRRGIPLVTLKTAATADGRIATASGQSQWITGDAARADVHRLRAEYDAVLVGSATVVADDPLLTCRLPGLEGRSPIRIVLDAQLRTPLTSKLVQTARDVPVWLFTAKPADEPAAHALRAAGIEVHTVELDREGFGVNFRQSFAVLAERGITRVLVEAGGLLAGSLLVDGLVDRLELYRAPSLLGGDAQPMTGTLKITDLAQVRRLDRIALRTLGPDVVESFRIRP